MWSLYSPARTSIDGTRPMLLAGTEKAASIEHLGERRRLAHDSSFLLSASEMSSPCLRMLRSCTNLVAPSRTQPRPAWASASALLLSGTYLLGWWVSAFRHVISKGVGPKLLTQLETGISLSHCPELAESPFGPVCSFCHVCGVWSLSFSRTPEESGRMALLIPPRVWRSPSLAWPHCPPLCLRQAVPSLG